MNRFGILGKCGAPFLVNSAATRNISVTSSRSNMRWRLNNGYPRYWLTRGTLADAVDFSYKDDRPSPYTSGQRARFLKQKEYTERIIFLLNGMKYANQRKVNQINKVREEAEIAMTRKLKWKGVKETEPNEEVEPGTKRFVWKRPKKTNQDPPV